jgi:IS5 family transposase
MAYFANEDERGRAIAYRRGRAWHGNRRADRHEIVEPLRVIRGNRYSSRTFPDSSVETSRPRDDAAPPASGGGRAVLRGVLRMIGLAVALFGGAMLTVRPIDRTIA